MTSAAPSRRGLRPVDTDSPDAGLFGPGSVTWRVHGDPMMLVSGLRSLFLQALHPVALHGVLVNSSFRKDPWGRLARTAEHVGRVTFGTTTEATDQGRLVRGIHARLRPVTDPETGRLYRVDDPDLLLWVHVAEVSSFVEVARRSGLRLSPGDVDRYYAEQVTSATLVGLDPATVPASATEITDYLNRQRPLLRATPSAREVARFVLLPPMSRPVGISPARPAWAAVAGLSFAALPGWARRRYRLLGLPTTDAAVTVQLRALRAAELALPLRLREGPHLAAARQRLGLTREQALAG